MKMERESLQMGTTAPPQTPQSRRSKSAHVLVFPYPFQGHICPMVEFSKRLASKGVRVTVVITTISAATMSMKQLLAAEPKNKTSLRVEIISDGSEHLQKSENKDEVFNRVATQNLSSLISNIKNKKDHAWDNDSSDEDEDDYPLKCVIYHSAMPWVLDIARQHGIDGAPFFTCAAAVTAIFHHFYEGVLKIPSKDAAARTSNTTMLMPSMPGPLGFNDLPSFLSDVDAYSSFLNSTMNQFSNIAEVKWIFHNTCEKLEEQVLKWMASQDWPVKTIGPTIPSSFLDKRLGDEKDYSLSLFKPDHVETCMKWLDSKETGSVVYVSFGSLANLTKEQMEELAWGLNNSNYHFLWVIKESEKQKLPINFFEEISEKGLVVSWCSQLRVLAHKAVGCFVTHCGWNSTLEALSLGVPMVTLPQFADQTTNAKFVADVWKVGVRVKLNEKGFITKEELEMRVKQVMDKEVGVEIRKASLIWKELAKEAVDEGGSSDRNIEEFAAQLRLLS
ncbi:mogroside IE synthase-like [Rosa rugosa]|uniref:mogroside IE synthase-like n=1 Tax=Rosa rugosa TaxID=74645 RepID=UPI002B4078AC|nr:mogroside IE synthase-like [Rosa rugosa]